MKKKTATKRARKRPAKKTATKKVAGKKMSAEERLLAAAEDAIAREDGEGGDDTAPLSEEELQELLDSAVLGTYIDGQPSVAGTTLMDITALTLTLLKKTGNGLVSGMPLEALDNSVLEGAKLCVLWGEPEDGDWDAAEDAAIKMARPENADDLEHAALKWLGKLKPKQLGDVTNEAIFALKDAMSTQVEPIPHKGEDDADDDDAGEEVEGNG